MPVAQTQPARRLLIFGMDALFTRVFIETLLALNTRIHGLVFPARSRLTQQSLVQPLQQIVMRDSVAKLALDQHIPVTHVDDKDEDSYNNVLQRVQPHIIVVACFPYRIPDIVSSYPSHGAYNIHPSLLPAYRGPVPIFWQRYFGETNSGVTIHQLTEQFDHGDIAAQKPMVLADGLSTSDITRLLAQTAASEFQLMLSLIAQDKLRLRAQDESQASYQSMPQAHDFIVPRDWSARRAYNFICASAHWGQAFSTDCGEQTLRYRRAEGFQLMTDPPTSCDQIDGGYRIGFSDGTVDVLSN